MARNPMDVLLQDVVPHLTAGHAKPQSALSVLTDYFPVLLTALTQRGAAAAGTMAQGVAQLFPDAGMRRDLMERLSMAHDLPLSSTETLVDEATPRAIDALEREAGAQGLPAYLSQHRDHVQRLVPVWWSQGARPAAVAAAPVATKKMSPLLPLIGLLGLGLLAALGYRACHHEPDPIAPTPVTTVAPAVSQVPASFSITTGTGNDVYACRGFVGDASLRDRIMAAVSNVFGGKTCNVSADQAYATQFPTDEQLNNALNMVKAVPYASLSIDGNNVIVNAPDASAMQRLVSGLQGALPGMTVRAAPPLNIDQAVAESITAAQSAMNNLNASSRIEDLIRVLNLQIINFASDSDVIPAGNLPILDRAAELLKGMPSAYLHITGHTDSTGTEPHNMDLSQRRAEAVRQYLLSKGVSDGQLSAQGMASTQPVADNVTELGKFRNRRIEFGVGGVNTVQPAVVAPASGTEPAMVNTDPMGNGTAMMSSTDAAGNTTLVQTDGSGAVISQNGAVMDSAAAPGATVITQTPTDPATVR